MRALLVELENALSLAEAAKIAEVYIGGGTPTVDKHGLLELLDHVRSVAGKAPVSVEAHPLDIEPWFLRELRRSGVERLSIGVQSFQAWKLERLGRTSHGVGEAVEAVRLAEKYFPGLNIDIVWGVRGETIASLCRDAAAAFSLGPGQATFYPIMPPPQRAGEGVWMHPEEHSLYHALLGVAERMGYRPSTPWCMDRGSRLIDEYVVDYTEFIAVGVSGIGRTSGYVYLNEYSPEAYARLVAEKGLSGIRMVRARRWEESLYRFSVHVFDARPGAPGPGAARAFAYLYKKLSPLSPGDRLFLAHCMQKALYTAVNLLRKWGMRRAGLYSLRALQAPVLAVQRER